MRVTSALWVAAYLRRRNSEGLTAVVMQRGAEEAGAIVIVIDRLDGTSDIYVPAPQSAFAEEVGERLFQRVGAMLPPDKVEERLARERRFDPDLWLVAVEDRHGVPMVEVVEEQP